MEPNKGQASSIYDKCALFSLFTGFMGMTTCCYPPLQLVLGAAALILAYISKTEHPLTGQGKVGMVLGIISVIVSLLMFAQFVLAIHIMDDPANAPMIRDIFKQYQDLLGVSPTA